jgi:hypothetical protein
VMPDRSMSRRRFARVMLRVQLAGMTVGAIALVYVLGFSVHPHQVGYACLIAACYLVFTGIATFFTQLSWRAQARRAAYAARHADGAVTTENAGRLDAPGVRGAFRSQRRAWLSVTLLGMTMLIAFLVLVDHYEGQASALESSGVHIEGVVTRVTGQGEVVLTKEGEVKTDGAVDVQYVYAGQTFDTHIYLDDTSPTYRAGEAVTVTLDPSDPQIATVGGSDNEGPALVTLLAVLLVGGGFAVVLGLGMLIRTRLAQRRAASSGWEPWTS